MPRDVTELRATLDRLAELGLTRLEAAIARLEPSSLEDAKGPAATARAALSGWAARAASFFSGGGETAADAALREAESELRGAVERFLAFGKPQSGELREALAIRQAAACFARIAAVAEAAAAEIESGPARSWTAQTAALAGAARARLEALRAAYRCFVERDVAAAEGAFGLGRGGKGKSEGEERARMRDVLGRLLSEPSRMETALALLGAFAAVERLGQEAEVLLELTSYTVFGQTFTERLAP